MEGLNDELGMQLMVATFKNYQELVDRALMIEGKQQQIDSRKRKYGQGKLSAFWERGSPDLPTCGVAQVVAQYGPSSSAQDSRPSRGAKPREADNARPLRERPHLVGS